MAKMKNPRRIPPEIIGIIPAKGGSVSIPYKNLMKLGNKTLLQWAIEVAFKSKKIDLVAVTTEDKKIASLAKKLGALIIPEPKELAMPDSDDSGWYRNAVEFLEKEYGWKPEIWVNLRPTGPLREPEDVDACVEHVLQSGCDGLKSVIPSPIPPYKMWRMHEDGSMEPLMKHPYRLKHGPDIPRQRAQKLFPTFWQDAQIDITKRKFILSESAKEYGNCFGKNIHGYLMDSRKVVDIDTMEDFHHAEKIMKQLKKERTQNKKPSGSESIHKH